MATALKAPPKRTVVADPYREARARLKAALKPDVAYRRVGRDHRILARLILLIPLPVAAAALMALQLPAWPADVADWRAWVDPAAFALVGLVVAGVFARMVSRTIRAWESSAPDSPEAALREFYRAGSGRKPRARRLARLVTGFEAPQPAPRPVLNWMTATAFDRIDSPKMLARYWHALLRGNPPVVRRAVVREVRVESPKADVALARVTLRAHAVRRLPAGLSALVGVLIAAAPLVAGPERLSALEIPFWGAIVAAAGLGVAVALVLRKLNKTIIQRQEVVVYKILVRSAQNWRLLSGEWESADEADASWLLKA